jgi:uncharacterized membrane protein YiaA
MNDKLVWFVILLTAYFNARTDIDVIHMNYDLDNSTKNLMYIHQIILSLMTIGILFTKNINIKIHTLLLFLIFVCFFMCKGCILAIKQREAIPYTNRDLLKIHGTHEDSRKQILLLIPLLAFNLYKLKVLKIK